MEAHLAALGEITQASYAASFGELLRLRTIEGSCSASHDVPLAVRRSPGPHWQAWAGGLSGPVETQPGLRVKHGPGSCPAVRLKAGERVMGQQDSDELRVPAVSRVSC